MEVLLRGQLGGLVREGVARRLPISEGRGLKSWRDIMPLFISVTMETMYPLFFSPWCHLDKVFVVTLN